MEEGKSCATQIEPSNKLSRQYRHIETTRDSVHDQQSASFCLAPTARQYTSPAQRAGFRSTNRPQGLKARDKRPELSIVSTDGLQGYMSIRPRKPSGNTQTLAVEIMAYQKTRLKPCKSNTLALKDRGVGGTYSGLQKRTMHNVGDKQKLQC